MGVKRRILLNLIEMRISDVDADVVPYLADSDTALRCLACRYLGEFGKPTSEAALVERLADDQEMVRDVAESALRNLRLRAAVTVNQ